MLPLLVRTTAAMVNDAAAPKVSARLWNRRKLKNEVEERSSRNARKTAYGNHLRL